MTDTPDVDAAAFEERGLPGSLVVHVDFARRIKREFFTQEERAVEATKQMATLSVRLTAENEQHTQTKALLEKQKAHSLALQNLLAAVCVGKPPVADPAAPEHSKLAAEHHARYLTAEAKRIASERSYEASVNDERRLWNEKLAAMEARMEEIEKERRLATELTVLQEHLAAIEEHIRCILPTEVKDA